MPKSNNPHREFIELCQYYPVNIQQTWPDNITIRNNVRNNMQKKSKPSLLRRIFGKFSFGKQSENQKSRPKMSIMDRWISGNDNLKFGQVFVKFCKYPNSKNQFSDYKKREYFCSFYVKSGKLCPTGCQSKGGNLCPTGCQSKGGTGLFLGPGRVVIFPDLFGPGLDFSNFRAFLW